jgi:hypothetical protein
MTVILGASASDKGPAEGFLAAARPAESQSG